MKKTIRTVDVTGKRVLVRADLNVPIEGGRVSDDARIHAALPTLNYLIEQRARIILLSHLGRPDGFVVEGLRMNPVAERLAALLQRPVTKINNVIGPEVEEAVKRLQPGDVLLLENVRFHPGELVNDAHFSARLASVAEVFVSDAFASAHRAHASTTGVAAYLPAAAGLLMESELNGLERIREMLRPPVVVLLGGERLVDKAGFIEFCLGSGAGRTSATRGLRRTAALPEPPPSPFDMIRGARLLFGGVLANTLLRAAGLETGQSRVEMRSLRLARELLTAPEALAAAQRPARFGLAGRIGRSMRARRGAAPEAIQRRASQEVRTSPAGRVIGHMNRQIELPQDVLVADIPSARASTRVFPVEAVPETGFIVDLGPRTVERYLEIIAGAGTLIWSGPLGMTEIAAFSQATHGLAERITALEGLFTIVGGGDSTAALDRSGFASKIDYLSTGGAAFLAALQGQPLPGVIALEDREEEGVRKEIHS